jgi:hypothetical protein
MITGPAPSAGITTALVNSNFFGNGAAAIAVVCQRRLGVSAHSTTGSTSAVGCSTSW